MRTLQTLGLVISLISGGGCRIGQRVSKDVHPSPMRVVTLPAQPRPLELSLRKTALIVVDMQNDFVSKDGLLDRIGYDIRDIQRIVPAIRDTLAIARKSGLTIVYLKMGYRPDLSDIGSEDSPMGMENRRTNVGGRMLAPDGREGRYLIRDTWNTDIVETLKPQSGDLVVYKTRYSGFHNTELDKILRRRGLRTLIITGCTTSVCVESTVRDAMFRDYHPVLLSDCTAEPLGREFSRSNHEASLFVVREASFGTVATSVDFARAIEALHGRQPRTRRCRS